MFDIDRWQEIFYSIKKNKLRTFLSSFTIMLGLFIFIFLLGIGNGLTHGFIDRFIISASNLISVVSGTTTESHQGFQTNRKIQLKNEDLDLIKKQYTNDLQYLIANSIDYQTVFYKSKNGVFEIQATYPEMLFISKIKLLNGRFINQTDMNQKLKYAVLGRLAKQDLFGNENALGKYISLNKSAYKIIGVFSNSKGGDNEERIIYTPLTTAQAIKKNTSEVSKLNLTYNPEMDPDSAISLGNKIDKTLRNKLQISSTDKSGLYVRNSAETMQNAFSFMPVIMFVVVFIGFGTIIAGIIGISNIMVFIVKERTKEIGIRKALGAKPSNIVWLILQESIFITTLSGIIGVILGTSALSLIGDKLKDYFILNPSVDMKTIIIATVGLIFSGTLSGFIPARKASKIKPIEALRS